MKRSLAIIGMVLVALLVLIQVSPRTGNARTPDRQGGEITIESWLQATPDKNGLSGIVTSCFKLKGAFVDQNGDPAWSDTVSYTGTAPYAAMCGDWQPVGGFVFVPAPAGKGTDTTVYALHTITGQKGQLYITFSGTYDLVTTFQTTSCNWVITGGTGAYAHVQGSGTCTADASHFPFIRHTEKGTLYLTRNYL